MAIYGKLFHCTGLTRTANNVDIGVVVAIVI